MLRDGAYEFTDERGVAGVLTLLPPYFGLEGISKEGAGFLTIIDRIVKLIFYYGHERAWFASNFGVTKNK